MTVRLIFLAMPVSVSVRLALLLATVRMTVVVAFSFMLDPS